MLSRDADIRELFCELVAIPSPSGRERVLGEQIAGWLQAAGVGARFDDSGPRNGSDAGNLIATVPGAPGQPTLLFVAHMDTVETGGEAVRPVQEEGVIRSAGETILGADNKSAVAAVMRTCVAAQRLPADRRPTVVAAFTSREESGRMGASLLDLAALGIDCAFCVDGSQPIGTVITRALGQTTFVAVIHGRAAHMAAAPETGIDAIAIAAEVIAKLGLGRGPRGTGAGVAAIIGGSIISRLDGERRAPVREAMAAAPTNSVPDLAYVRGEVRGYTVDEIEEATATIAQAFRRACDEHGATLEWIRDRERMVPPLPGTADSRALALVRAAAKGLDGVTLDLQEARATLEANHLAADVDVVAVASGGRGPHQTSESIAVAELEQLEALLTRIVELAGGLVSG